MRSCALTLIAFVLQCVFVASVYAAPEQAIRALDNDLDAIEKQIGANIESSEQADKLVETLEQKRNELRELIRDAQAQVETNEELLASLGPAPGEGQAQESAELRRKREDLTSKLGKAESQVKTAQLLSRRIETAMAGIGEARFEQLTSDLLQRGPAPYQPKLWRSAISQARDATRQILKRRSSESDVYPGLLLLPLLGFLALGIYAGRGVRRLLSRWGRDPELESPGYGRRLLAALVVAFTRGFLPALVFIGLVLVVWNLYLRDVFGLQIHQPIGIMQAVLVYLIGSGFVRAATSPHLPAWRVLPLGAEQARIVGRRALMLVAVEAVHFLISFLLDVVSAGAELRIAYGTVADVIAGLLLASIVSPGLWSAAVESQADEVPTNPGANESAMFWPLMRTAILVVGMGAPLARLAGFHTLSSTVLHTTLQTLALMTVFVSMHVLLQGSLVALFENSDGPGARWRQRLAIGERAARSMSFWLTLVLDIAIVLGAMLSLFWLWGTPPKVVMQWLDTVSHGIPIGSYTLVPADLVLAVLAFLAVWIGTRLVQGLLERRLLPRTRLDIGVRTAITAGLGYIGLTIALLIAVSVVGLDLTKLALIAGALSVGIGFGLQNIVNNFVSGLILLIERPIKIGDWVMVGGVEGTVRRINVRSTRIETFNRADVIIPNADLLQQSVVNWTHKSKLGRVDLAVGVAYQADIELVEKVLLECANEHPKIQRWPSPHVLLRNFGDNSLDFELRFFLSDIEERVVISSDLRKSIVKAFREHDIEIPFPQRDIWIRDSGGTAGDADSDSALS